MRLKNKIGLITGAARGIGQACASLCYAEGARLILTDIREDEGRNLAKELGSNVEYLQLDVGSEQDWQNALGLVKYKYGSIDFLVNNAGITGFLEAEGPWDAENCDL
jgi:3(or 17)beta-hydroxysteroid dehydrogenase